MTEYPKRRGISRESLFMILSGGVFSATALFMVFFGALHVDEGYYHLVAHLTSRGAVPYRDYFYVQMPLFPYVYGLLFRLLGHSFAVARFISVLFSLAGLFLATRVARRLGGVRAAAACAGLIAFQPFTIYYLSIVKLYAVCALLLVFVVLALTLRGSETTRFGLAAFFLALGTGCRMTIAAGGIALVVLAFLRTRNLKLPTITAAIFALTLLSVLIPFIHMAPDTLLYDVLKYHFDKESFSPARQIYHRLLTVFQLSNLYFLPLLIAGTALVLTLLRSTDKQNRPLGTNDALWVLAAVTGAHFMSQAPYVYRYLAMLVPAYAAILGPEAVRLESGLKSGVPIPWGWVFILSCLMTLGARGLADAGKLSNGGPLVQLESVAQTVKMLTPPDKPILTFNNSVAVEADRDVIHGDEMNVLSYDPAWTTERCKKFSVLNVDMLERYILEQRFGAILITRTSFLGNFPTFYNPGEIGARPRIMAAVQSRYVRIKSFPGFGYMGEKADLYVTAVSRKTGTENTADPLEGSRLQTHSAEKKFMHTDPEKSQP